MKRTNFVRNAWTSTRSWVRTDSLPASISIHASSYFTYTNRNNHAFRSSSRSGLTILPLLKLLLQFADGFMNPQHVRSV